jgi:hypothetical protein
MVSAFLFFAHFIFILVIFTWKYQKEGLLNAFLNVGLVLIFFAVGWTITGMIAKILLEAEGFGRHYDRDTFSLTLLSMLEFFFYKAYYKKPTAGGKGTQ